MWEFIKYCLLCALYIDGDFPEWYGIKEYIIGLVTVIILICLFYCLLFLLSELNFFINRKKIKEKRIKFIEEFSYKKDCVELRTIKKE